MNDEHVIDETATHIEQITGDNYRPGMKYREGYLVRHRRSNRYGWLCCSSFPTRDEADTFAESLKDKSESYGK